MTKGWASVRASERIGMPPSSSIVKMLVKVISNWSEKPTTSKSESGRADSSVTSGSERSRSAASRSNQGAKQRSMSRSGVLLTTE